MELLIMAESLTYYVHPSAYVDEVCQVGEGTKMWHLCHIQQGALIRARCSFGQNQNLNDTVGIMTCSESGLHYQLSPKETLRSLDLDEEAALPKHSTLCKMAYDQYKVH
jgi:hypothetical protein